MPLTTFFQAVFRESPERHQGSFVWLAHLIAISDQE